MKLRVESREGVLWVHVTGQVSRSDTLEMFRVIRDAAVEQSLDRVLVDCSAAEGELAVIESYELGATLARCAHTKPFVLKVATVGEPPLIDSFVELPG